MLKSVTYAFNFKPNENKILKLKTEHIIVFIHIQQNNVVTMILYLE
jgi:hypothetical protein